MSVLEQSAAFVARHIGTAPDDQAAMLEILGYRSRAALIDAIVPAAIRTKAPLALPPALSEQAALARIRSIAAKNKVMKSFIGQGYYGTHTPGVILRNVLENPAWYTAYTPYQPEISQGRLEALVNFQTMICDMTAMAIANASMLDEATAAAEAMTLCHRLGHSASNRFFVAADVYAQTIDVVRTRATPLGIDVVTGPAADAADAGAFAVLLQYPGADGDVRDYRALAAAVHAAGGHIVVAADLLALTLLTPPGEWGADVVVGSAQRFGVPMGCGGPHAAYLATRDDFKRSMPGRLVGVTVDANGGPAYRLALQTREQHIRREKATSNICTAQVLLAVMAAMYAVYHGPAGLTTIARRVHRLTAILKAGLERLGHTVPTAHFFDTIVVATGDATARIADRGVAQGMNFRRVDAHTLGVSLDETSTRADVEAIWRAFGDDRPQAELEPLFASVGDALPDAVRRVSAFLTHPTFNRYHSETEMLRYLRRLADRDIALDRAMIPLGSCTMKLNATSEMIPVTWPEFGAIHPFAPADQTQGYREIVEDLEHMLCAVTGYAAVSLQPNAGSQGEYAGLLVIKAFHASRGEGHRNVCLIPASAHGTNPASAQMAGMRVVVVACDAAGNVDMADLEAKARTHRANLAAIMVTYPSTHGVFEAGIGRLCAIVHEHGGQVYVDGANLNALVGLAAPGEFGADVSHLNLHKTFCIPHGGGGPGVGPIGVGAHLARFLPGHRYLPSRPEASGASSAAPERVGAVVRRAGEDRRGLRRALGLGVDPADLVDVHRDDGRRGPRGRDRKRDPRGKLRREASRSPLSRAVFGAGWPRRARVHSRPPAAEGGLRHRGGRRREAADRLRLPRAHDELSRGGYADGRAYGKRIEGGARPLHRSHDRDPRRNPRCRGRPRRSGRQRAEARAPYCGGGRRRRLASSLQEGGRRLSRCLAARGQILATGRAGRQCLRRSPPVLQLPPVAAADGS